jgi:cytochrome c peroxidase
VASDVIDIQEGLTQQHFDRERLIQGMVEAFHGDPQHKCMGRSAPARLANAIAHADEAKLDVPTLREISSSHT